MKYIKYVMLVGIGCLFYWLLFVETSSALTSSVAVPINPEMRKLEMAKHPQLELKHKDEQESMYSDESIAAAAEKVISYYESTITYPAYSQPLTEHDKDRLEPNVFYPVSMPVDDLGNELTVSLPKYRFVYPENILIDIQGDHIEGIKVSLMEVDNNMLLLERSVSYSQEEYQINFGGKKTFPRNLQIKVLAKIDNVEVPVIAQIQYMQPSAKLTHINRVRPDHDKMSIETQLEVFTSGIYRVRANLYSANKPIAHLVSKSYLKQGKQTLNLSAHWSVLPKTSSPMQLSQFVVELMSPKPGQPNIFGSSDVEHYEINEFALDSLQKVPYQPSSKELKSLAFLKALSKN